MQGRIVVTLDCPACGRRGVISDPATVARLGHGARPARFRCDRSLGGCGLFVFGAAARLIISWDSAATPFDGPRRKPSLDPDP